jgi:hypothetical protein
MRRDMTCCLYASSSSWSRSCSANGHEHHGGGGGGGGIVDGQSGDGGGGGSEGSRAQCMQGRRVSGVVRRADDVAHKRLYAKLAAVPRMAA